MIGEITSDADAFDADIKLQFTFLLTELLQPIHIHAQLTQML